MREASAEGENALSPAARVSLSTHALCQKKYWLFCRLQIRSGGKIGRKKIKDDVMKRA